MLGLCMRCMRKGLEVVNEARHNGNYYSILGFYRDNGKENGNYCIIFTML